MPTQAASCMEVCSMPCTVPTQRRGLHCTRKACLAGMEMATAMPSRALKTRNTVRLRVKPYTIHENAENV